jgi:hypothetical protein
MTKEIKQQTLPSTICLLSLKKSYLLTTFSYGLNFFFQTTFVEFAVFFCKTETSNLKTTGCVAACIGIWFRIDRDLTTLIQRIEDSDLSLTAAKIYLGSNVLISVGSMILFIGLIGVFGSVKENEYVLALVNRTTLLDFFSLATSCLTKAQFQNQKYSFLLVGTFGLYMTVAGWGFYSLDYVSQKKRLYSISKHY